MAPPSGSSSRFFSIEWAISYRTSKIVKIPANLFAFKLLVNIVAIVNVILYLSVALLLNIIYMCF